MKSHPTLRGEGLEIRYSEKKSEKDRRKYNVHVDPNLLVVLVESLVFHQDEHDGKADQELRPRDGIRKRDADFVVDQVAHLVQAEQEKRNQGSHDHKGVPRDDADRLVLSYLVTDEQFEAADGDEHCTEPGQPGGNN